MEQAGSVESQPPWVMRGLIGSGSAQNGDVEAHRVPADRAFEVLGIGVPWLVLPSRRPRPTAVLDTA
jgi:hypothetical protein